MATVTGAMSSPAGWRATPAGKAAIVFHALSDLANPEVGDRLRAHRKLAGLSQDELAVMASDMIVPARIVTQSEISRLEISPGKCKLSLFVAVCKALSITLGDILEESVEPVGSDILTESSS